MSAAASKPSTGNRLRKRSMTQRERAYQAGRAKLGRFQGFTAFAWIEARSEAYGFAYLHFGPITLRGTSDE